MKSTKKILTTTLSLVLMMLVLGTGVFAWFTINTKTSATGLSGKAEAADGGFYIRLYKEGESGEAHPWTDELDLSEIANSVLLKDITTQDGINFTDLEDNDAEESQWIEFDLEFITGSINREIYLENLTMHSDESTWISEIDISSNEVSGLGSTIEKGYEMKAKLADAIRVSLVEQNKNDGALIVENDGEDKNVDVSIENKVATFKNTTGFGGFALAYYNLIDGNLNVNEAPTNRGDKTISDLKNEETPIVTATSTVDSDDRYVQFGEEEAKKLDESFNHTAVITVRVWLEGWDKEAFNAVSSGKVDLGFTFRAKEA